MGIVTEEFYNDVYMGEAVETAAFPKYEMRAEELIKQITRGATLHFADMPDELKDAVQKAICAQIEFFAVNGIDTSIDGNISGGFTVGKVTLQAGATATAKTEAQSMIAPMAFIYLEQTGLLNRNVATLDAPWVYWH